VKVIVRIDALAMEANWPRSARADFADQLEATLAMQLRAAAARGAFGQSRASARRCLALPASALTSPMTASSGLASTITAAIGGPSAPALGGTRGR